MNDSRADYQDSATVELTTTNINSTNKSDSRLPPWASKTEFHPHPFQPVEMQRHPRLNQSPNVLLNLRAVSLRRLDLPSLRRCQT